MVVGDGLIPKETGTVAGSLACETISGFAAIRNSALFSALLSLLSLSLARSYS